MNQKLWLITAIMILCGCDSSRLYEANEDFSEKVCVSDDIRSFSFDIPDSTLGYNIYFNVRNTMKYPHYNIYISYRIKDSVNQVINEELINFDLFDPKSGNPYGQSSLGDIFDHQFLLHENFLFESSGTKVLELQQYMRYDSLPEIVSCGIRIEKAGTN